MQTSPQSELRKILDLVIHHAYGAWNYRWLVVGVVWVVCLIGWFKVYTMPDTYGASTVVYVDTESVLRPLLRGLSVETDVANEVGVMTRAVVSRPNIEAVAREIDLDVKSATPAEFERRLISLEERIDISRDGLGVYKISYEDANRETALTVVKSLLNTFVEDTLGNKSQDTAQAEHTLREQIEAYEKRLVEAEDRLKSFKQKNVGMMPGERGDYYQQLQTALTELEELQRQLRVEQQRRSALQRQLAGEEPVFGLMTPVMGSGGGALGSSLDGRIAELERRLADASVEYTDKHPEIVRTRSLLEDLKAQRREELAAQAASSGGPVATTPLDLNPVYQNMKIQLSDVQVEIASLSALVREKEAEVDRLRELVDVIPQVEAELMRLNRDYDVVQARYQEMLERWENLQTSQRVSSNTENVKFRIIEPPHAPSEPTGPPRALFLVAVFVLSLALGIGVAVLLTLIRPVFFRSAELASLNLPVIGTIGRMATPETAQRRRMEKLAFVASLGAAMVALVLVTAFAGPASELIRQLI